MKVEVIDNKTYSVKDVIYEIGDKIELTDEEKRGLLFLKETEAALRVAKQTLVTKCHLATKNFDVEIADLAHRLNGLAMGYTHGISALLHETQRRLGGMLPLSPAEDYSCLTVTERGTLPTGDKSDVNHTVMSVKRATGMLRLEGQRRLAVLLAQGSTDKVEIDLSQNDKWHFQPITAVMLNPDSIGQTVDTYVTDAVAHLARAGVMLTDTLALIKNSMAMVTPLIDTNPQRLGAIERYALEFKPTHVVQYRAAVRTITVASLGGRLVMSLVLDGAVPRWEDVNAKDLQDHPTLTPFMTNLNKALVS